MIALNDAAELLDVTELQLIAALQSQRLLDEAGAPTAEALAGNFIKANGALTRRGLDLAMKLI